MLAMIRGLLMFLGRALLVALFLYDAVAMKIPDYENVVKVWEGMKIPSPQYVLGGAIACLIIGGVLVLFGFFARFGAFLLTVFLVAEAYYFHAFWKITDSEALKMELLQFLRNTALLGAMVMIIANGAGPGSIDALRRRETSPDAPKSK